MLLVSIDVLKMNYITKNPYILIKNILKHFSASSQTNAPNIIKHQVRQREFFEIENEKYRRTNQIYN